MSEGTLFVVATPLGNLGDISVRAKETLASVDMIYCEDTRHSQVLLQHLGIQKPLKALHEHNETAMLTTLITALHKGQQAALISDAGTPLISDPGFTLVREARAAGINIVPIPGPCALITALMGAGLPCDKFIFQGFLPAKSQARQHVLTAEANQSHTQIYYEAPHRILDSLADFMVCFGEERQAVLAREMTKRFESWVGNTLAEILTYLQSHPDEVRGEMVLVVAGHTPKLQEEVISLEITRHYHILREELPLKQAVKLTAKIHGISKNVLYDWALTQEPKA